MTAAYVDELPEHLVGPVAAVRAAYPSGVPEGEYGPLVYRLCESMSMRNVAHTLHLCGFRNYYVAYNDTQAYAYRHDQYADASKPVLAKIVAHGFVPDED